MIKNNVTPIEWNNTIDSINVQKHKLSKNENLIKCTGKRFVLLLDKLLREYFLTLIER